MHQCRDTILNTVNAGFDNSLVQVHAQLINHVEDDDDDRGGMMLTFHHGQLVIEERRQEQGLDGKALAGGGSKRKVAELAKNRSMGHPENKLLGKEYHLQTTNVCSV